MQAKWFGLSSGNENGATSSVVVIRDEYQEGKRANDSYSTQKKEISYC
jgi:hypothetical protein